MPQSKAKAMYNKRLIIILTIAAMLLSMPFFAMQFTDEVQWTTFDFIVMGILLLGTGAICELVMRKVKGGSNKFILCAFVLFIFLLIWAELAVGVFGTPFAGA